MKKIRVLEICGEASGGIRKHINIIVSNLDMMRYEIYYVYSLEGFDNSFTQDKKMLEAKGVRFLPLRIRKRPSLEDIANLIFLYKFVLKNEIDIVHGHGAKAGLYARGISVTTGINSIYTPHGGVLHDQFSFFESRLYILAEKLLKPLTYLVLAESENTKKDYIEKVGTPKKIEVNLNGVKELTIKNNLLRNEKTNNDFNIGIFARLSKFKGQVEAVEAISELAFKGNIFLHLYGDGPLRLTLEKLIKEKGLTSLVSVHGEVVDVEQKMLQCDCVLIPSYFESFSYVAVEAMMLKIPIISSYKGGLKEVLNEECCLYLKEINSVEIAKSISKIYNNKPLRNKFSRNAYIQYKKNFTLRAMIENIDNFYQEASKDS